MHQADLFRDQALAQVQENAGSWFGSALDLIPRLTLSDTFTGEDLRHAVEIEIGPPHHHNAYGALISQAVRKRYIIATGEYRKMRDVRSHARKTAVYRKEG